MTLLRKARKLLRDPQAFFKDSKMSSKLDSMLVQSILRQREMNAFDHESEDAPEELAFSNPSGVQDVEKVSISYREFQLKLASRVKVFFIDEPLRSVICVSERDRAAMAHALLSLCDDQGLQLHFHRRGSFNTPKNRQDACEALVFGSVILIQLKDRHTRSCFQFELQIWREHEAHLEAPRANPISRIVWKRALDAANLPELGKVGQLQEILQSPPEHRVSFDVDYVYTWVNSEDPDWQDAYRSFRPEALSDATSLSRFLSRDELKYSLRSLEEYAPWVRKIHIVSNCAPPSWLNLDHPKINWVTHEQIFDANHLPTFSSHAIESQLHKIEGLSEHFIYSNDDFLLTRPSCKEDFFEPNGICKLRLEKWGNVNGSNEDEDPDYLNAARNGQKLIERDFNISPTRLQCHAPNGMRRDILIEMEKQYVSEFEATAASRFRTIDDISVTSFFFGHYAHATGRAVSVDDKTLLIQSRNNYDKRFKEVLKQKGQLRVSRRYLSICINDGVDSHLDPAWNVAVVSFLKSYLRERSQFETKTFELADSRKEELL